MPEDNRFAADERRWAVWMAAANDGDKAAYENLLTELADVIEAYVYKRFGALPYAEDCVQECLMALHKARGTYDPGRPFRPWMFTLVHHKTIDVMRKARRHQPDRDVDMSAHSTEDASRDTLNDLIDGVRVLQRIAPDHRNAVALTQYAGYTISEAARELGISESALKARLRRGLIEIRRQLDTEDIAL